MLGRTVYGTTGSPYLLAADGNPELKAGAITLGWSLFTAISGSDLVAREGFTVKIGQKWASVGQVVCKVTTADAQTLTVSGTPTGGSITLNVFNPLTGAQGTVVIPFNASVATAQGLFDASVLGTGGVTVSGAGVLPGNVHTITASGLLLYTVIPTFQVGVNALTGGSSPAAAIARVTTANANLSGYYGPYDPAASDGRQNLNRGDCYILNESIVQNGVGGIVNTAILTNTDQVGGAIYGGRVWKDRLIQSGVATHTLAAGPTLAELLAAFPRLVLVGN